MHRAFQLYAKPDATVCGAARNYMPRKSGLYILPEAILTIILLALPPVEKVMARLKVMATSN